MNAAKGLPRPPDHVRLRPGDMPFWEGILRARAREEWNDANLVIGAQLARCQHDIEVESLLLEADGTVVTNDRGTQVVNPRVAVLEQFARREMALMRCLQMGGRVSVSDPRGLVASRKLQRTADEAHRQLAEDDLLA